jgi:glycolate oxidase
MLTKLTKELNKVLPPKNVLLDIEERYVYSFDASESQIADSKIADAVVFVETIEEVQKIVKIANKYKTPIICRGAGTNTVGSCVPVSGGIVLNFSKMNKILELNTQNMTIKVQPGVTVGEIQNIAEKNNLFYPPDPSNLKVSTIGGSIAQNSAGARCFKYGSTKNYLLDLKVVTAVGELISTGSNTVKNAVGYDLNSLFTGSEGTLGIVVEATLKLIPKPQENQVLMAYFENIDNAVKCVNQIIEQKIYPSTIDFMDNNALRTVEQFYHTGLLTDKECALLIEIDGDYESVLKSSSGLDYKYLQKAWENAKNGKVTNFRMKAAQTDRK